MTEWSPTQYLQFEKQRTQPAIDLAARVADRSVRAAVDVGCGAGTAPLFFAVFSPRPRCSAWTYLRKWWKKRQIDTRIFRFEFATQQR